MNQPTPLRFCLTQLKAVPLNLNSHARIRGSTRNTLRNETHKNRKQSGAAAALIGIAANSSKDRQP
jgi:hypothetical protein